MKKILFLLILAIIFLSASATVDDCYDLTSDVQKFTLGRLDRVDFELDERPYSMKVISVDEEHQYIEVKFIKVGMKSLLTTIDVGETEQVDLTNDTVLDVAVTLHSINVDQAEITFKLLKEEAEEEPEESSSTFHLPMMVELGEEETTNCLVYVFIFVIIIAVAVIFLKKEKLFKHRKS